MCSLWPAKPPDRSAPNLARGFVVVPGWFLGGWTFDHATSGDTLFTARGPETDIFCPATRAPSASTYMYTVLSKISFTSTKSTKNDLVFLKQIELHPDQWDGQGGCLYVVNMSFLTI